jgi:hypothetical protein
MGARHGNVFLGLRPEAGDFLIGELPHNLSWNAENKGSRRNHGPLRDEGAGANDRMPADDSAIQYGRMHSDQALVFDRAGMHHGEMADSHIIANNNRVIVRQVDDRTILYIGPLTDLDEINITPQDA